MRNLINFSAPKTISCQSREHLKIVFPKIFYQLRKYGHCVVQMWDSTESSLLELRNYFGRGQLHIRADSEGIVEITPRRLPGPKPIDPAHYFGIGNREHPAHTDGAYLNGFLWQDNAFRRVGPPAVVIIQCVHSALQGGTSYVIDAQSILRDILISDPDMADILLNPGCVSFCRDDHMASGVSVYERVAAQRWRIRFRSDDALYVADWAHNTIQRLQNRYLTNPQYQKRIDLKQGEVLLLDNFRVLHGREAFDTNQSEYNRFLRRIWIYNDDDRNTFINFKEIHKDNLAFKRYSSYALTQSQSHSQTIFSLELGIRLPRELRAIVDRKIPYFLRQAS